MTHVPRLYGMSLRQQPVDGTMLSFERTESSEGVRVLVRPLIECPNLIPPVRYKGDESVQDGVAYQLQ